MKGQTQQVFIYIMVILVVGAVLLFGYKSIGKLISKSCDVDQVTFQAQLKDMLEKNNGYGDISTKPINAPCGYEKLCFINSNTSGIDADALGNISLTMKQEVQAGTGNNVFLVKSDETKALYGLDFLSVNEAGNKFLCLDSQGGKFYMTLEGAGKGKVKITPEMQSSTAPGGGTSPS